MRKSERLRLLEIELVKTQYEVQLLREIVSSLIDSNLGLPDMEAGKWYKRTNPNP